MKDVKKMTTVGIKREIHKYLSPIIVKNRPKYRRYKQLIEEFERRIRRRR